MSTDSHAAAGAGPQAADSAAEPRRFLMTGVVSHYRYAGPDWDLPQLSEDRDRITGLFDELGYLRIDWMGPNPRWEQIRTSLRDFARAADRRADDYLVVYLAGHGQRDGDEHIFMPSDFDKNDPGDKKIKTGDLAEWLLDRDQFEGEVRTAPLCRVLLLLDTCYSGSASLDLLARAAKANTSDWPNLPDGTGFFVVSAAGPRQPAEAGVFTTAFVAAVRRVLDAKADGVAPFLDVMEQLKVLSPENQRPRLSTTLVDGAPQFFVRRDALTVLDPALVRQRQRERRDAELEREFLPRAKALRGRHTALAEIVRWLKDPAAASPLIVTGEPGSGKSAVLGLIAALSSNAWRHAVSSHELPSECIPDQGSIDVSIYSAGLTSGQVLAGLGAAAHADEIGPEAEAAGGIQKLLADMRGRGRPLIALIDALDEVNDPAHTVGVLTQFTQPAEDRQPIRLLLGARPRLCDQLASDPLRPCLVVDLDREPFADPDAISDLITQHLLVNEALSDLSGSQPDRFKGIVDAISERAGHSFLVAEIVARTQSARDAVPDPADAAWLHGLAREAGSAMHEDLRQRLGYDADGAMEVLLPLAYAQGEGLPWESIWPALADALSPGAAHGASGVRHVVEHAGSFVSRAEASDREPRFRLYHRALADAMREGRDAVAEEHAIVAALMGATPRRIGGAPDWTRAHPYTQTHLADHAARSGDIDALAQDPGFLLTADPARLVAALAAVATPAGSAAADAFRAALPALRHHAPVERPAYLELAARCGRATALADNFRRPGVAARPWSATWAAWGGREAFLTVAAHAGPAYAVAISAVGGEAIGLSGGEEGIVAAWSPDTGTLIRRQFPAHAGSVRAVMITTVDGAPAAISAGDDGRIYVSHLLSAEPIADLTPDHVGRILAIAVTELDGRTAIVSAGDDGTIRVTGLRDRPLRSPIPGHAAAVNALAVTTVDGGVAVVSASDDETLLVSHLESDQQRRYTGHAGRVKAVAIAELNGSTVVVSGGDDRIHVWDPSSLNPIRKLPNHANWVRALTMSAARGQKLIVSAGDDGTVRVWDLASGEARGDPLAGPTGHINGLTAMDLGGSRVASVGDDGSVRVWYLLGRGAGEPFAGHRRGVRALAAAELGGGPVVIGATAETEVRVWELATGRFLGRSFRRHHNAVSAVTTTTLKGNPAVVSAGADNVAWLWDLKTRRPLGSFRQHRAPILALATANPDTRQVVVSADAEGVAWVWDPSKIQRDNVADSGETKFARHNGKPVLALARATLGTGRAGTDDAIVSADADGVVWVWNPMTGEPVGDGRYAEHSGAVLALAAATLDGRPVVVSAGADRTVRVWDLQTHEPRGREWADGARPISALGVASLNGQPVVAASDAAASVYVWDLGSGESHGQPYVGHVGKARALAVTELSDRTVVVSGDDHRNIRAWHLDDRTPAGDSSVGHRGPVNALAVVPGVDSPAVVSAGDDGEIRVWHPTRGGPSGAAMADHAGPLHALAAGESASTPVVVSAGADGTIRVWDVARRRQARDPLATDVGRIRALAVGIHKVGPVVVSAGEDAGLRVWDLDHGGQIGEFAGAADYGQTHALASVIRSGRSAVITAGDDGAVLVWDLIRGSVIRELPGLSRCVRAVAVGRVQTRWVVAAAGDDGDVLTWDLQSFERIGTGPAGLPDAVRALAVPYAPGGIGHGSRLRVAVAAGSSVMTGWLASDGSWESSSAPDVGCDVRALALADPTSLVAATSFGLLGLRLAP